MANNIIEVAPFMARGISFSEQGLLTMTDTNTREISDLKIFKYLGSDGFARELHLGPLPLAVLSKNIGLISIMRDPHFSLAFLKDLAKIRGFAGNVFHLALINYDRDILITLLIIEKLRIEFLHESKLFSHIQKEPMTPLQLARYLGNEEALDILEKY